MVTFIIKVAKNNQTYICIFKLYNWLCHTFNRKKASKISYIYELRCNNMCIGIVVGICYGLSLTWYIFLTYMVSLIHSTLSRWRWLSLSNDTCWYFARQGVHTSWFILVENLFIKINTQVQIGFYRYAYTQVEWTHIATRYCYQII